MLIDTHAHLVSLENPEDAIIRAGENGVGKIVAIASDLDSSHATLKLSNSYDNIYATVGIHPHAASSYSEHTWAAYRDLTNEPKVVAVGETGLDYHYMNSPKETQILSFQNHIALGKSTELPLVIHIRDAHDDMINILRTEPLSSNPGVIHCFTGDRALAETYLDLGFYISFSGIVTFKRSEELRDAAKYVPGDRILIETDSPYLAPVPHRGKPNEPAYVKHVAETLADVRGLTLEQLEEITTSNAQRLFSI